MMVPQGFIRFNCSDGQSLTVSKTDYSQQQGFKSQAEPAPKVNLGSQPVGDWGDKGGRPYIKTLTAG